MQTISRNIALGHGIAVSDGTIQTNGTQPLATFVFSLFHLAARGDKIDGIFGVELFSVLVSLGSAWLLYALVKKLLIDNPDGRPLAMLVAGLWFASPTIVKLSMNGVETGLYFLASIGTLYLFATFVDENPDRFSRPQ